MVTTRSQTLERRKNLFMNNSSRTLQDVRIEKENSIHINTGTIGTTRTNTLYEKEEDEMYDDDLYPTDNTGPWGLRQERIWPEVEHPTIRNYRNIIRHYQVDIVQPIYLPSGHMMCIPKTFWLKILQRKYKKYYKDKANQYFNEY